MDLLKENMKILVTKRNSDFEKQIELVPDINLDLLG
jgi:hypothetical protein